MRRISGSSTAWPSRHLLAEHLHNRLWVTVNDGQHDAAMQIYFAAHMGKNLAQGRPYLLTHLGSFRRHRLIASFLIAATGIVKLTHHRLRQPKDIVSKATSEY